MLRKTIAKKKDIEIGFESPPTNFHVNADLALIERAISNLLDNGIKYTESGGSISVCIASLEEKISMRISDTGQGIAKDKLPKIFDRYHVERGKHSKEKKGSGLGVAIVKGIIEAHGEELFFDSELNRGTWFEFQLPKYDQNLSSDELIENTYA